MKKLLTFLFPLEKPTSLLALSIQSFTNESFFQQINRQGRLGEYLHKK
jgi:hypothetical protein